MKTVPTTEALRAGWVVIAAAAVLVAGACGGSSSSSATTPGGGGAGGEGAVGSGGGSTKAYSGSVTVGQSDVAATYSSGLLASFTKNQTPPPGAAMCTSMTSGSCTFSDCTAVFNAFDAGPALDPQNIPAQAGNVSISGGKLASPIALTYHPAPENRPALAGYTGDVNSQVFAAGDRLTVTATGQDVAAFSGTSGPAPADIALTAPAPTGTWGAANIPLYTIDEAKDLTVTWTGGSSGSKVNVILGTSMAELGVTCNFDATTGRGTVPSVLLTKLGLAAPNASSGSATVFAVTPQTTVSIDVSNADVQFQVIGTTIEGVFMTP